MIWRNWPHCGRRRNCRQRNWRNNSPTSKWREDEERQLAGADRTADRRQPRADSFGSVRRFCPERHFAARSCGNGCKSWRKITGCSAYGRRNPRPGGKKTRVFPPLRMMFCKNCRETLALAKAAWLALRSGKKAADPAFLEKEIAMFREAERLRREKLVRREEFYGSSARSFRRYCSYLPWACFITS